MFKKSFILTLLLLTGCVVVPINSAYKVDKGSDKAISNFVVNVKPFVVAIKGESYNHSYFCPILTLIPLVPKCTYYYKKNAGRNFNRFVETMEIAFVKDLKALPLFKDVVKNKASNADFTIEASIHEFSLAKKGSFWGLSIIGAYAGLLAVPTGWAKGVAEIEYTVYDNTNQKIFSKVYKNKESRAFGYYYPGIVSMGAVYKPINQKFFKDLKVVLAQKYNLNGSYNKNLSFDEVDEYRTSENKEFDDYDSDVNEHENSYVDYEKYE